MLKTLDILIGVATVMLLFSLAVTIVTQFVANLMQSRGKNLLEGLAGLLKQIDPKISPDAAKKIADTLLKHPLVAEAGGKLGEVIHREEFTTLLLGLSAGESAATLEPLAKKALDDLLAKNGITDPAGTLKNIRAASLQLEAASPELANDVRHGMAILQEAKSQFVAKVHGWFDQTIDRVSSRFTVTARIVTFIASVLVATTVQLDTFALVNRLSVDDQFRTAAQQGANDLLNTTPNPTSAPAASGATVTPPASASSTTTAPPDTKTVQKKYYDLLSTYGMVALPTDWQTWHDKWRWSKIPGILLSALLLSLGAPFWYGRLQDLLKLRSTVAQNDAKQRTIRQTTQTPGQTDDSSGAPTAVVRVAMAGERGDTSAVG
jgi:hypothetical protein